MHSIGPYRLDSELGRGAMGAVFRGFDPAIGRPVAIKIIQVSEFATLEERSELKLRFAREATAAGKLSHPNIVTIHQFGEHEGIQFLVLELIEGSSLEQRLSSGQPHDAKAVISVLSQVAEALDYAHSQGVVHRDVKPANILVGPDGKVKITDFGIARIAQQTITRTGFTMGTLAYMAPEQILAKKVDGKADQFSLAVVAYRMLSGKMPFIAENDAALMFKIVSSECAALHLQNPALPPRTSAAIQKALAKNAAERFATCGEFVEQLTNSFQDPRPERPAHTPRQDKESRKETRERLRSATSSMPIESPARGAHANWRSPAQFAVMALRAVTGLLETLGVTSATATEQGTAKAAANTARLGSAAATGGAVFGCLGVLSGVVMGWAAAGTITMLLLAAAFFVLTVLFFGGGFFHPAKWGDTNSTEEVIRIARDLIAQNLNPEALSLLTTHLIAHPREWQAYQCRGQLYCNCLNSPELAVKDFTEAIALAPTEAHLYVFRAQAYSRARDLVAAREDYDSALRLQPEDGIIVQARKEFLAYHSRKESSRSAESQTERS
jgi:serine/threonine protein kinase